MATFFNDLPPEIASQYEQIERKKKIQEALMAQALQQNKTQYGRSGNYQVAVPYSPLEGATKLIQAAMLNKQAERSDEALRALGDQFKQGSSDEVSRVMAQAYGGDAPYKMNPDETFDGERIPGLQTTYEADPRKAALMGVGSQYPSAQRVGEAISDMNTSQRGSYFKEVDVVLNGTPTKILLNARTGQVTNLFGQPIAMTPEMAQQIRPSIEGSQINQGAYGASVLPSYSMPVDPRYSAPVQGDISKAKEQGKVKGADTAQAQIDAPRTEASTVETLRLTDKLRNHPGMKDVIGFPDNPLVAKGLVPGTAAADFRALKDEITGRTFMEIYPTLKGGGQITEIEGEKGQAAINRMKNATSEKAFLEALDDFDAEVERLNQLVKKRAGMKSDIKPTTSKETIRLKYDAQGNFIP